MNYSFKSFVDNKNSVTEGNAFSMALKKAKEDGEKEFEVDGKTYKVEEAEESGETTEEPKAPKLMSFDDFVKDKSTADKADDESGEKVATSDEVDAKLPSDKEEEDKEDKEKEDLEDKEAKDDAKGEEEEEEEEEEDLDALDA